MSKTFPIAPIMCVFTTLLVAWAQSASPSDDAPVPPSVEVKWHPGHYALVSYLIRQSSYAYKDFRGVQKFYNWRTLEPEKDHYDFSAIRSDLAFLQKHEKRLVMQIQTKAFARGQNCCPAYISGPKYGGGVYKTGVGALNPIIWDDRVNRRLLALYRELGRQFDSEPYVEGMVIPETAVTGNVRNQGEVPYTIERYAQSVEAGMQAAHNAFPHTVVIQYFNLPVEMHQSLFDYATTHGIGLGGPDIFIHDPLLNDPQKGSYPLCARASGIIPLGTAVQPNDYLIKVHAGPPDPPTPQELYDFGREKLHLNYMFWSTKSGYFEKVQAMMDEPSFPKDPAGGLNTARPKSIGLNSPGGK
jgi:hypothetical protein